MFKRGGKQSRSDSLPRDDNRQHRSSRTLVTTLKNRLLLRNRTSSVNTEPVSQGPPVSLKPKCATLPVRGSPRHDGIKQNWMTGGKVGEIVDSSGIVSRENSEESVDSGFHQQLQKCDEPPPPPPHRGQRLFYDVSDVEKAFGPMKDIGRWYSTYSTIQYEESRYVNGPLPVKPKPQLDIEEEERLTSRPLPPIPGTNDQTLDRGEVDSQNSGGAVVKFNFIEGEAVYEFVEHRMMGSTELTLGLRNLAHHGWYWGPITRLEAEERLTGHKDGTFLVRDSSDDRYLLSLSFRSQGKTLHTRIEYCNGHFSFYSFPDSESEGYTTVVELIQRSMEYSQKGVFCFSRARALGSPAVPVRLLKPFSRFNHVRSLQHYCRFVIRQSIRFDMIRRLPLPQHVHGFLEQSQY